MESALFSSTYGLLESQEKDVVMKAKDDHLFGLEDWGGMDPLFSEYEYGFNQQIMAEKGARLSIDQQQKQQQQQQPISNYSVFEDFHVSAFSPPIQPAHKSRKLDNLQTRISDFVGPKDRSYPLSFVFELLNNYGNGFKKLKVGKLSNQSTEVNMGGRKLSTEEIMRVAGARFIELSAQTGVDSSMIMHPFGYALSGLSEDETGDVELAHVLLSAAEKVGYQQFVRASRLLTRCEWIASNTGTPVQRIVFYFARALRERIDAETGRIAPKGLGEKEIDELNLGLSSRISFIACYQKLPFAQVVQFTGIQALMEKVASANKVHLIDLGIRSGVQWTILMQALAQRDECPIEQLKITAVGTTTSKPEMEETGKRLESIAKSLNLNFLFKIVSVSNMEDIKEELFEREADEVVAVYSLLILRTMISRPCLETLMRVIKKLKPSIMMVTEVEANHNSPKFVNRFIEALFFYGAYFDCLEACMDRNDQNRMIFEAYLGEGLRNIVAAEGKQRAIRSVKIDVWRAFFARFGLVEMEFSEPSLYQASLVTKMFACGNFCTIDTNGKCLIVGWKGTPMYSLSAWKFC